MTTLAAVLVRQRSAPLETVEQAMLRQSLFGGDLATNLLELKSIEERPLLDALAIALECPPLDAGPIGEVPAELRDVVPSAMLSEYLCIPLGFEGDTVVLATASPLPESITLELTRRYGKALSLRATLELRIRQALALNFGLELDMRAARILARLDGIPFESLAPPPDDNLAPSSQVPTPRISLSVAAATRTSTVPSRREPTRGNKGRRLGPMTAAMAEAELSRAASPGEVIDTWLDFAAQYFDYTAIFAIQGDLAAGKQARGAGTTGEPFSHIGVPLDLPSVLERARRGSQWLLTALEPRGLDRTLARDLGRIPGPQVLLLPISVRERVVLLTYGDHGSDDVELERVGDVLALRPLVERQLERLVVERKRGRSLQPSTAKAVPAPTVTHQPGRTEQATSPDSALPTRPEITSDLPTAPSSLVPFSAETESHTTKSFPHEGLTIPVPVEETPAKAADESWDLVQPVLSIGEAPLPRDIRTPTNQPAPTRPPSSPPGSVWPGHSTRPGFAPKLELITEAEALPTFRSDSHPAQLPLRPSESQEMNLPTVLVDTETDCMELIARLTKGDVSALDPLVEMGDTAIGVLVREMPGPTTSPSRGPRHDPIIKASDCGPILRALAAFGPAARPYVIARTSDGDPKIRAWSVRLLGELGGRPAAVAVSQRVVLDRDAEVKRAAHVACQLLYRDPESAQALRQALLETAFDRKAVITQRLAAIDALTDLRDVQAIPSLIDLLLDPNPGTAAGAGQALSVLARQDFGYDQKRWLAWWQANANRERIEWVIDALEHRQTAIRQAASEELRLLSRLYVGDYDDDSGEARAKVQQKYRDWWAAGGRGSSLNPKG